ncbi:hypothetical protein [Xenorhabdus thailandensis]|uniref:DUF7823 domain-containing protein n=1 Tax=Xenorhabdus thailandensis TaxID=3136255 RepID=UPI0030F4589C
MGHSQAGGTEFWGFIGEDESSRPSIGNIDIKYDKCNVGEIVGFYWADEDYFSFDTVDSQSELFEKTLLITVDGITYNLGKTLGRVDVSWREV